MDTDAESLEPLVVRSASGEQEAARVLYEKLVERIFPFVVYRVQTREDALDITQEVFIDFFKGLSRFSFSSNAELYAYLFVIARRKLSAHYTKKGAQNARAVDAYDDEVFHEQGGIDAPERLSIAQALEALDEESREIVVLHHWSRYSFPEIAQMLNKQESAVRVRHHRALHKLKTFFNTENT